MTIVKFFAFFSTGCLICLLIATVVDLRLFGTGVEHRSFDSPAIVKEVRQLNELVTVRYGIEFRLYAQHRRGATVEQLAVQYKMSTLVVAARVEAARLCLEKQVRIGDVQAPCRTADSGA